MSPRDDLDGQATTARARRRPDDRGRRAGRLVARAEWLSDAMVFWTGRREDAPRLGDTAAPLRAALQDRIGDLPQGLYAVRVSLSAQRPLSLEFASVEAVTRERVASTARAIESAGRFPRAAARFVGPVPAWRARATALLEGYRRAVEGARAWHEGGPGALALEARAIWLGSGPPPSTTLPEAALAAACRDPDATLARLAAAALGKRHAATARDAGLAAWGRVGLALDRWPAAVAARAAAAFGAAALAGLADSSALNDPLAAWWVEERGLDPTPAGTSELAGLARLLSALHAVGEEAGRRDGILRRLAAQYLQIAWGRGPGVPAPTMQEVADAFREVVLDQVYGSVREIAQDCRPQLAGSMLDLGERWLGKALLGVRLYAYIDSLMAPAAAALGSENFIAVDGAPDGLSRDVTPGSALDPAGPAVAVAAANRLRWNGAPDASEAMAAWIETCRPLLPLGTFWRDVFTVLPLGEMQLDGPRGVAMVASLAGHRRELALELALDADDASWEMRGLLPAVLARGPLATGQVLTHRLWLRDEEALDAALEWLDAAGRAATARANRGAVPVPRSAFETADLALRDTLLEIGLRVWADGCADAGEVQALLAVLARQAPRRNARCWTASRVALADVAAPLVRRSMQRVARSELRLDPFLVYVVLDVCAEWASAGFGDVRRLARILVDRWISAEKAEEEWSPEDRDRNELLVGLSEGRVPRVLALLQHPAAPRQYPWRALDGWGLVQQHARARAWTSACLDCPELVPRVVRLLERLALVARLEPGLTAARLFAPIDHPPAAVPAWPAWLPPDARATLDEIALARGLAGEPTPVTGVLRRILERAEADRERAPLRELSRALPKQAALAGLAALEALARADLGQRWQRILGGEGAVLDSAAWDNALHMLLTVKYNRRVLVRLLRHAARGDRFWMRDLQPNKAFLASLAAAGLRPHEWLAERSLVVSTPRGALTAYAATDPLEVLQMGSLFGTCLSAGKFNAHAAVAAAVEVNKRVLFVKDGAGRVLGRRLLALTPAGELIGFTTYGAGADQPGIHGTWVKLALELLALEVARACGASLMTEARVSSGLSDAETEALMLFCRGYVDSPERFDWWIEALAAARPASGARDHEIVRSLLDEAASSPGTLASAEAWEREERGWAASRALAWLGADAALVGPEQEAALGRASCPADPMTRR